MLDCKKFVFICFILTLFGCVSKNAKSNELEEAIKNNYVPVGHQKNTEKPHIQQAEFGLNDLISVALQNNPAISSARYKWQASAEKYPQVTSLPDPMLTYTYFLRNVETRVGPQNHKVTFMQKIPFPRKLYLQGEIIKDEVKISRLAYERTIRNIATKSQNSFYELAYIKGALEITKKNEDLLGHLIKVSSVENAKGNTPLTDVMKGQSQLAQLGYDRIRLEELKKVEIGQLNALLNRDPQALLEIKDFSFMAPANLPQFKTLYQHAKANNQEVLASKIAIDKANHKLSLAFSQYFPDLSIGFSWIQVDKTLSGFGFNFDDDGQDVWTMTFGVNLPIWVPKRNARVRESRLNIKSAKETRQNLENQLAADLKKIYYQTTNARRLVKLYSERLLPEAQKSMSIAENWHRDGKGSLTGLLEAQSVWQNFSLALLRAQTDYAQNMAKLAKLCGGSLPTAKQQEKASVEVKK